MNAIDLAASKQGERELWAAGDYDLIARRLFWDVGALAVERAGTGPGDRALDVACGSGNAAIRAAAAGADVVGVDLTPEMFGAARRNAAAAGVAVDWVEGDAEALPFADESFDVVLSVFGCMFAPRHEVAARELGRVLAPGGRLVVCSWTPQSAVADLMRLLMPELKPDPAAALPPPLWGKEEHVRGLFEGSGVELEFERDVTEFRHPSVEEALALYETRWGPFMAAREQAEPQGRWPALRAELAATLERHDSGARDGLVYAGEYLTVAGRKS